MTTSADDLAKKVRVLILEIDKLGYVFNEIVEKYLDRYAEDEDVNHPIRKLSESHTVISNTSDAVLKILVEDNILGASFRNALGKLALMDRLKDGERKSEFVSFVDKNVKD